MKPSLIVTSSVPGRRRGGAQFTGAQSFALDHFSAAQLKEIAADPVLTVVVGQLLEPGDVDEFLDGAEKAKGKATK